MRRLQGLTCVACVLWLAMAPDTSTAGGLDLRWDDCASDGGVANVTLDCANPESFNLLYGTFVSDVRITDFTRLDFVIDYQVDAVALPGFWHPALCEFPGGCNALLFTPGEGAGACQGAVRFPPASGPPEHTFICFTPTGPGRGRLRGFYVPGAPPRAVSAAVAHIGFLLNVQTGLATEAGWICDGCTTPATIVFNEASLIRESGPPVVITGPGLVSNCVTANGGGNVSCGATPARRGSWGAIKSLYR